MFRFVGSNSEGLPLKRKQTQRACEECRRRKKRCLHVDGDQNNGSRSSVQPDISMSTFADIRSPGQPPVALSTNGHQDTVQNVTSDDSPSLAQSDSDAALAVRDDASWREGEVEDHPSFIGDLNPEGAFLAGSSPSVAGPATDSAGVWLQRQPLHNKIKNNSRSLESIHNRDTLLSKLVFSHLEENCLSQLPGKDDYRSLRALYIEHVHPVYPVLDYSTIPQATDDSPAQVVLKQAVCLAASTTPKSKPHLNLPRETGGWILHSSTDFAYQMTRSIRTSMYLGLVRNRLRMLRLYSILSFFTQLADDKHSSAQDTASAVSYLHTIGLHLETRETRRDHEFVTRLFCCVWLLDRLNAAFHGRPVLMHERDFGRNLEESFSQQEPAFQLLLRVAFLLDQVIALYRPAIDGGSTGWDAGFPAFEELIDRSGAFSVPSSLLATIETLYHAVAMLTCRSKSMTEVVRSSASFARQTLSASAIIHIVTTEYCGQLTLLPVVPYAVSLALRCAYRELRLSRSTYNRERAKRQLMTSCNMLRDLAETFPSAMQMVELAEQTIQEMEKVVSTILNTQQAPTKHRHNGESNHNADTRVLIGQVPNQELQQTIDPVSTNGAIVNQSEAIAHPSSNGSFIGTNFDVFDYFDPDFDLDAIDAMLGDNIELSFPYLSASPETCP